MRENMDRSFGLMFSQRVLLKLTAKGLARQTAYELVQKQCHARVAGAHRLPRPPGRRPRGDGPPQAEAELDECFDPSWHLRNVDAIFRRLDLGP